MRRLLFFVLALAAVSAYAEERPVLLVEPPLPREGQNFTVSFRVPHAEAAEVSAPSGTGFPDSVTLLAGPMISPLAASDPETGEALRCTELRYTLRALRPGRSILGPLAYSVRGKDFSTCDMILELSRGRDSLVPFSLVWRLFSDEVYEGEAVAALLEMQGLSEIRVPEAVAVAKPAGTLFEEVQGLGGISSVSAGGREIYSMVVSSWMLTPSSPGVLNLPAARVKASGLTIDSEARSIRVKSLPPEVKLAGAVGNFTVNARPDRQEILLGETVSLSIRVEGRGNLNYLRAPHLEFADILITGPETSSQLEAENSGYRGWVEWVFRLSPQKQGSFTVRLPVFSWIDPESGRVSSSADTSLTIRVRASESAGTDTIHSDRPPVLRSREVEACEPVNLYAKPYMYAFIIPCGFFFVWGILRAKRKKISAGILGTLLASALLLGTAAPEEDRGKGFALVEEGAAAYDRENYEGALKLFFEAADILKNSTGVFYNIGLTHAALKDAAGSVFWLRMAAFRNPSAAFIAERLSETEKAFGITHAAPVPGIHPDAFYALFAAAVLIASVLPWFIRRGADAAGPDGYRGPGAAGKTARTGRNSFVFACLVAALLCAGFSAGGIAYQAESRGREWGVVTKGGAPLRKIPRADSSEWLALAEGTAVDIVSRWSGFALVATGSGIEGWIEERSLLANTEEDSYGE